MECRVGRWARTASANAAEGSMATIWIQLRQAGFGLPARA